MRGVFVATVGMIAITSTASAGAERQTAPRRAPQAPQQWSARASATFNVPSGSPAEQNAIGDHVDELAADAPRGALIRLAMYQFTSQKFAQTLVAAARRGVDVRVVVDATSRGGVAYQRLAQALGASRKRSSWIVTCAKGCIGDTIMHNKFYLYSRTGSAEKVVVQASANLTTTNRVNAWNNAFTISDATLYQAYGRYFSALSDRRHRDGFYHVTHSGDITAYTFPRAARNDTLYDLLGHVDCERPTAVHATTYSLTRTLIARRLWTLAHIGCDVRVIYTNLGARARKILERPGGPQLLNSHYTYVDQRTGRPVKAYVHSKYVAIDGTYAGQPRQLVITGSPNFTTPGLRDNDEAMLAIDNVRIHAAYEQNFSDLWQAASARMWQRGMAPDAR